MKHVAAAKPGCPENYLSWEAGVPFMTNPFILYDLLLFCGLAWFVPSTVVSVTISLISPPADVELVFNIFKLVALILVIFALFFAVASLFFLKNRFFSRYVLNGSGVALETAKGASALTERRVGGSFFAIRPYKIKEQAVSGYGSAKWVPWEKVAEVKAHRSLRVISLTGGILPVMRLYCPDSATFDAALELCHEELSRRKESK